MLLSTLNDPVPCYLSSSPHHISGATASTGTTGFSQTKGIPRRCIQRLSLHLSCRQICGLKLDTTLVSARV